MNLASMAPVAIFTLLNVAMALGLYITAMSGQLSMATAAIAGVGGYLAAVLTVKFGWALLPATCLAAIAGALVGTAGAIQAHYVLVVSPHDLGFFVSLNFIIFLLFGGLQTLWGPMLGAVLLTVLPEMLRFTNEYRLILYGLIIVVVVLRRPEGLLTRTPLGREL